MQSHSDINGDFEQQSLTKVLESLSDQKRSGVLRIGAGSEIWVDQGAIYLVLTPSSPDIESVLFGSGVVSTAEVSALIQAGSYDAAKQLVNGHPEAAAVIDRLLHELNLSGLFELIVPSTLEYGFEDGVFHPVGSRFAEPAGELIAQAERRLQIWTNIAARIPSTSMVFRISESLPGDAEERLVTADEWRYLALLDGKATVADVISSTGESAFRVCSSLYRLLLEELIAEA